MMWFTRVFRVVRLTLQARGSCGRGGHDYFVENVRELLDVPTEWWVDTAEGMLYYYPNGTGTGAAADGSSTAADDAGDSDAAAVAAAMASVFVASRVDTLFVINGTASAPAIDLVISGFTLTQTAPTFLDSYEVPSAGDWCVMDPNQAFVGHGVNGHGVNGHGVHGHGVNGHGVNGHGVNGHGANGHCVNGV
jgi:hypothetical protein